MPNSSQIPPDALRGEPAVLTCRLNTHIWLVLTGCAVVSSVVGFIVLFRIERMILAVGSSGFFWSAWFFLGVIPLICLLAAWWLSVRQHRDRIAGLNAFTAAIHHSLPDLYGESDFQNIPAEFRALTKVVNGLEARYRQHLQSAHHDLCEVRARHANLQSLFNSATVMVFGLDRTGQIHLMNVAAEQLSGYMQHELEGDGLWYTRLFPLPHCAEGRNIFNRLQDGAPLPGNFDTVMMSKSGKKYIIHWFCSEIFQTDADVTYSLIGIDVTSERHEALALHTAATRLEHIIRHAHIGAANLTPDGYFHDVNQDLCKFLGTPQADLLTKTYRNIVHPDDADQDLDAFRQLPDTDQPYHNVSRYIRDDGVVVWGALTASEQQSTPQAGRAGILMTISDVSPYKRAENELRTTITALEQRLHRQTQHMERARAELREFVSIASHDLKTPLRGISRLAYWLAQEYADCVDERGQNMTNMLIARVRRLDKLIDGLLEYSRVGQQLTPPIAIDLRRFINQLIMTLPVPQHIEIAVSSELPTVVAHPDNMRRLFQNLLNNAIQFLDKPAGSIAITCASADDAWVFRVRDNGAGIEPKYHQKIFHIFETLDSKDMSANTGIGLALVKKIITNYGGEIWVESTPGSGSTFVFTLPKQEDAV